MNLNCSCGLPAIKRTSWTNLNPGRRYATCDRYRLENGCQFWEWLDPPMCDRSRQIIPGLLRRVNNLEADIRRLGNAALAVRIRNLEVELIRAKKRNRVLWIITLVAIVIAIFK